MTTKYRLPQKRGNAGINYKSAKLIDSSFDYVKLCVQSINREFIQHRRARDYLGFVSPRSSLDPELFLR